MVRRSWVGGHVIGAWSRPFSGIWGVEKALDKGHMCAGDGSGLPYALLRAGDGLDVAHHIAVMSLTDAAGEAPLEAGYSLAAGAAPGGSEPLRPMAAREWSAPAPDPATIVLSSPPNTASVNDVQSLGQVLQQMVGTIFPLPSVASPPSTPTPTLHQQPSCCCVHWTCTYSSHVNGAVNCELALRRRSRAAGVSRDGAAKCCAPCRSDTASWQH